MVCFGLVFVETIINLFNLFQLEGALINSYSNFYQNQSFSIMSKFKSTRVVFAGYFVIIFLSNGKNGIISTASKHSITWNFDDKCIWWYIRQNVLYPWYILFFSKTMLKNKSIGCIFEENIDLKKQFKIKNLPNPDEFDDRITPRWKNKRS